MVEKLIWHSPQAIDEISAKAVACTVTKEEHRASNVFSHLDWPERYRAAGIKVVGAKPGEMVRLADFD